MIKTHGLSHLNLEVSDVDVSLRFYQDMFGFEEYFRDEAGAQAKGSGTNDVIAFVQSDNAGMTGGISHFGFRLLSASDIDIAIETAKSIGAEIVKSGEFSSGYPFLYVLDPDGYEIEIWYE